MLSDEVNEVASEPEVADIEEEESADDGSEQKTPTTLEEVYEEEVKFYLGNNPENDKPEELNIKPQLGGRIQSWIRKGLSKEELDTLLESIPRKGSINLEPPRLDDELLSLHSSYLDRDGHFVDYSKLAAASLAATATVFNNIINDSEEAPVREITLGHLANAVQAQAQLVHVLTEARRTHIMNKYEEKAQKLLKNIAPTDQLFGGKIKEAVDNARALEKATKDLKPKLRKIFRPNQSSSLNWRSSASYRKVQPRPSQFKQQRPSGPRASTSRHNGHNNNNSGSSSSSYKGKTPAKRNYPQSQPQRNRH